MIKKISGKSEAKENWMKIMIDKKDILSKADQHEETGDISGACRIIENGLKKLPSSAHLYARLGYYLMLKNQYCEAIKMFDKSLAIKPMAATTIFMRSECFEKIGHLDSALSGYKLSAEIKPRADCFINIGLIHKYRCEPQQAADAFFAALQLEPANEFAKIQIAELKENGGVT